MRCTRLEPELFDALNPRRTPAQQQDSFDQWDGRVKEMRHWDAVDAGRRLRPRYNQRVRRHIDRIVSLAEKELPPDEVAAFLAMTNPNLPMAVVERLYLEMWGRLNPRGREGLSRLLDLVRELVSSGGSLNLVHARLRARLVRHVGRRPLRTAPPRSSPSLSLLAHAIEQHGPPMTSRHRRAEVAATSRHRPVEVAAN